MKKSLKIYKFYCHGAGNRDNAIRKAPSIEQAIKMLAKGYIHFVKEIKIYEENEKI